MRRQKIKIMKRGQEVSEEEIRSYMNFDDLLAKRNAVIGGWRRNFWKWSIPVVAVIAFLVWQSPDTNRPEVTNSFTPAGQVHPHQNSTPLPNKSDSDSTTITKAQPQVNMKKRSTVPNASPSQEPMVETDSSAVASEFMAYSPAEPKYGEAHLYQYFNDNLRYPPEALKDSIEGVLQINFIINEDGKPEQITFVNSFGAPFEQEAIRVIVGMPEWIPAKRNGRPVKSRASLPLMFRYRPTPSESIKTKPD